MKSRVYVGYVSGGGMEVFKSESEPTFNTHGHKYLAAIGPFRTMRAARFMRDHGKFNPHCRCVSEAERLGRKYAGK